MCAGVSARVIGHRVGHRVSHQVALADHLVAGPVGAEAGVGAAEVLERGRPEASRLAHGERPGALVGARVRRGTRGKAVGPGPRGDVRALLGHGVTVAIGCLPHHAAPVGKGGVIHPATRRGGASWGDKARYHPLRPSEGLRRVPTVSTVPGPPRRHLETLSVREGRQPARERAHEGVPPHLERPLRDWLRRELTADLEREIALLLEVRLGPRGRIARTTDPPALADHPDVDLLDAIELVLQLDTEITRELAEIDDDAEQVRAIEGIDVTFQGPETVDELDHLLKAGNSVYRVGRHARPLLLVRHLDPTVQAGFEHAVRDADPTAAELLARAWSRAHGRQPDPDGAYHDAVRAVEALACPFVLPTSTRRTLSTVVQHLRAAPHKWELVLTARGEGSVEPMVEMFDRLWHGNLASRHGDSESAYREVTLDEARAGVQLAVLLMQWLTDGVLRRRDTTSTT